MSKINITTGKCQKLFGLQESGHAKAVHQCPRQNGISGENSKYHDLHILDSNSTTIYLLLAQPIFAPK